MRGGGAARPLQTLELDVPLELAILADFEASTGTYDGDFCDQRVTVDAGEGFTVEAEVRAVTPVFVDFQRGARAASHEDPVAPRLFRGMDHDAGVWRQDGLAHDVRRAQRAADAERAGLRFAQSGCR